MVDVSFKLRGRPMTSFDFHGKPHLNGNDKRLTIHRNELFFCGFGRNNVPQFSTTSGMSSPNRSL